MVATAVQMQGLSPWIWQLRRRRPLWVLFWSSPLGSGMYIIAKFASILKHFSYTKWIPQS